MLILPNVNIKLIKFDLSIKNRIHTLDEITYEAAKALKKYKIGVKCATINPDKDSSELYNHDELSSPNDTIRKLIGSTCT